MSYGWDQLNRMTSYNASTSYIYRADGLRVYKSNSSGSTNYRYDGQMGIEDVDFASSGSVNKTTDYGIGARGVDAIYITQNGSTSAAYPLYDAHGNMISTLARNGSGGYSTTNLRTFDAWGIVRVGAQTEDPKGRYCASIGHKQDDESGLVYMRARFYEPGSGRFLNEDPGRNGGNWFVYAGNCPITRTDSSGKDFIDDFYGGMFMGFFAALCYAYQSNIEPNFRDIIYGAIMGGAANAAMSWIKAYIVEKTAKPITFGGRLISWTGGIAAAAVTYYGIEAGQIMFELYSLDFDFLS